VSTGLVDIAGARGKSDVLESQVSFCCSGRVIRGAGLDTRLGTVEYNGFGVFWMDLEVFQEPS
jgi:hypothetical protein